MPITKRTFIDQIIFEPADGRTMWREATVIEEDGVELSRTYHRGSAEANVDPSTIPPAVSILRSYVVTQDHVDAANSKQTGVGDAA